jgi:hypothetical protein
MRKKPGCLKGGCFGCLGVLALLILIVGINLLIAWSRMDNTDIQDREMAPTTVIDAEAATLNPEAIAATRPGRVLLDLSQGGFNVYPAPEGESLSIKAHYDKSMYELEEEFTAPADSAWTYRLKFYRTMPWMQALFRQIMSDDKDPVVNIFLPRDIPIELGVIVQEGGFDADLGGLWITEGEILFQKGGFNLNVSEPMKEPMKRLKIHGAMGGFEADHLGNASPAVLDVRCRMGGAEIDLRGDWANDCDLNMSVRMGGMAVMVPPGIRVLGVPGIGSPALSENPEVPTPTFNFTLNQKMGEIEVIQ